MNIGCALCSYYRERDWTPDQGPPGTDPGGDIEVIFLAAMFWQAD